MNDQIGVSEKSEATERKLESIRRNLGPTIMSALEDPLVIEVMLNADGRVWIEKHGKGMYDSGFVMRQAQAEILLAAIAGTMNTVVTRESPILEGELPLDGSRFEGIISPVVQAPIFAIRKHAQVEIGLGDYKTDGVLTNRDDPRNRGGISRGDFFNVCKGLDHYDILVKAIEHRKNIVVIGGTGSGKTSLVRALLAMKAKIRPFARSVIIEDTRELVNLPIANKVMLRTTQNVNMLQLLRATLRLRPDDIIVGEVRGPEFLALSTAWNTGHPGGVATIHADDTEEGLVRMEQMMQQAGVPPDPRLISSVAHVLVWIDKDTSIPAGRKVRDIALVRGYDPVRGRYLLEHV